MRFFESLGGTCSGGESTSSGSRASYFQQLAADSETSNCIDFNLASIITFKDEQVAHSMTDGGKLDQVADFHTHRRRPNYDSRKRKFEAIQRPERSGYLNYRTSLTISKWFDFKLLRFFLGIMFLASVASQPRQASNGRSTARVKRLITSERCWCKKGCYQKFAALVNGLIQFLGIFWDLKKLQQDAYVSHLATLRVLNLPGNLIDGWTVKLWRPRCIGWQRRWLIARDGCCWALKFQESALQRYSA